MGSSTMLKKWPVCMLSGTLLRLIGKTETGVRKNIRMGISPRMRTAAERGNHEASRTVVWGTLNCAPSKPMGEPSVTPLAMWSSPNACTYAYSSVPPIECPTQCTLS